MLDAGKTVLRGGSHNSYIKKEKRSQISGLSFYFNTLEKEQIKPKISRRKEIIKITVGINEIGNRKPVK